MGWIFFFFLSVGKRERKGRRCYETGADGAFKNYTYIQNVIISVQITEQNRLYNKRGFFFCTFVPDGQLDVDF